MNYKALTTQTGGTLAAIETQLTRDPRLKSPNTRRAYRADLTAFEHWRDGRPFSRPVVEEYAARLQDQHRSPKGINRALAALRWWARRVAELVIEDPSLSEAQRRASEQALRVAEVKDVTGTRQERVRHVASTRWEKGRHVAASELAALMQACAADASPAGVRDAALIGLAWATGARVSELAALTLGQVQPVGPDEFDMTLHGKGDQVRALYVYNGAAAALSDWLAVRGFGAPTEPVFVPVGKGGELQRVPMARGLRRGGTIIKPPSLGPNALSKMLVRRGEDAKLSRPVTWHDFRRSFAGNLLDSGAALVTVQKLMGQSSPVTTGALDRRGDEIKRKAVRALHVPYQRRQAA